MPTLEEVINIVSAKNFARRINLESDIPVLYEYASKLGDSDTYLEIGTWMGCSAIVAALASHPGAIIWTIDSGVFHESHWQNTPDEYHAILHKNFTLCNLQNRIRVSLDGSLEMAWNGSSIDLLFIDGDHGYKGVKADIEKWIPFVSPSGIALFHDYVLYDGVKNAVDELILTGWQRLPSASENICAITRGDSDDLSTR